ncbi:restriction endonuclease subunit S [Paraburkholderia caribensis]|uniref:restriction endonuclease subunit S n=1 Tax=Paraburkholderia caribensis TaxID=75105 RepID=UPI0031DC4B1B
MTPGYKQTDAGVIPDDWELKQLGELSSVSAGGTPSRSNANYWGGDIPWITTTEIDFRLITESEQFITSIGLKNSAAKLMPAGALLMALYGQGKTRGKVGVLGFEAATNQACAAIILKEGYSREYAFHYLASRYDEIRKLSNTGNQENLNGALVRSIPVLLPPLSEQFAIATALSDVDALLSSLDALIAKKRDIKQAAMQQLLTGKTRLPGFGGAWVTQKLGDVATLKARIGWQGLTTAEYLDAGDYYLVTGTDLTNGRIDWEHCHYVTQSRYNQDQYIQIRPRDVLVTKDGTIGKVALVDKLDRPATLNSGVFVIRPKNDGFEPEFFYFLLMSRAFDEFLSQLSAGSTINHLYQKDFVGFTYQLPLMKEEQIAIAKILSDIDAELSTLETQRKKTKLLKQGMMQELLTGKTRLV